MTVDEYVGVAVDVTDGVTLFVGAGVVVDVLVNVGVGDRQITISNLSWS